MDCDLNYGGLDADYSGLEHASVVVLPVPYDETSTWGKGADRGPEALLKASANMELYDIETDSEVYKIGIFTAPPVLEKSSTEIMINAVHKETLKYIRQGKFVVGIGGEHSITTGFVRAHAEVYNDLAVLQLDAHSDLRPEYNGSQYNHACVMSRVAEICPFVQVGIRSMDSIEKPFLVKENLFLAEEICGRNDWYNKVIDQLSANVFITIDLDVFDPSIMPSTGTPEPGGLSWYEVIKLLKFVALKRNIVGFDVMELAPNSSNKAPDFVAAKLIYKLLSYRFKL
ncbi:MAG TPA: agmatinase [Bacteroidales bacterium]|jgi:agmatinase|nr:agmatinase [Bacteroidales bacterium]MBP7873976.1 agmatinase [Bacteroidales bacterium]MCZ2282035.1 agmatinase [Bacteroidales bacterium]HPX33826.1 agmatinase [Bacteroidales bacterium]HQB48414.1 agmatinase [Bacteroidales bacterium]